MASASATEVFNCTREQFFKIISDYPSYSEFLPEVRGCHVIETNGNRKLVEMKISVIKSFTYSVWMTETAPSTITWEFAKGDLFKTMSGSWQLTEEAGKTRAVYSINANFSMFVPGPIAKGIIEVNLPSMMSSYKKRVAEIYGG